MDIWLVGDSEDLSAAYVQWLAQERAVAVHTLREDRLGLDWWFEIDQLDQVTVHSGSDGATVLPRPAGAFVRLNPEPAVDSELGIPDEAQPIYVQERRAGLTHFLSALPFEVVNRPRFGRANGSKPFQMRQLEGAGFSVPPWVVTNELDSAKTFLRDRPEGAVAKACSGLRSHVRLADERLLTIVDAGTAPVLIQAYIPGYEVRVHTVGDLHFASRVHADVVDYRFDLDEVHFESTSAPPGLVARCREFAAKEGLRLAGFDFRVDREGTWWCLEMNPVPTFLPYEAGAGHPIGDAILNLLLPGCQRTLKESPLTKRLRAPRAAPPAALLQA